MSLTTSCNSLGAVGTEAGDWKIELGDGEAVVVAERGRGRRATKKISKRAKAMTGIRIFMAVGAGDWQRQVIVGGAG